MKKIFKLFLFAICLIFSLSACGDKANISKDDKVELKSHNTKNIVVTTSFLYDIVEQIAGDTVNVELIIPAGEDPHLYIAKPEDLKKLQSADLVLYHGLHFEGKMVEVLDKLGISVSKQFPKDKIGSMEEDGQVIIDPHFWFDISLYKMAVEETKKALSNLNPKDADLYEKNTEKYLFTPHDAFNYFSKSYGITVKAPQGVSTSSEVSNADIQETIDFIVEHKIKAVFAESTTDPARMEKLREGVVAKGFDVKIVKGHGNELFSDSLAPKGQEGDNYIDMYKHNVDLIVSNLSN